MEEMINEGVHTRFERIFVEPHDEIIPEIRDLAARVRKTLQEKNIRNITLDWV